jgi:hypothetical protein
MHKPLDRKIIYDLRGYDPDGPDWIAAVEAPLAVVVVSRGQESPQREKQRPSHLDLTTGRQGR